jgi:hypothetical protein
VVVAAVLSQMAAQAALAVTMEPVAAEVVRETAPAALSVVLAAQAPMAL